MAEELPPLNRPVKRRMGFATMDPERRREIARKGGASVPADRRSFAQDRELAATAGAKGGATSHGGPKGPRVMKPGKAGTGRNAGWEKPR